MLEETIARVLPTYYRFCEVRQVLLSLPLVEQFQTIVLEQKKQPNLEGKGKTSVDPSSSSLKLIEEKDFLVKNSNSLSNSTAKDVSTIKKGELEEEIDETTTLTDDDKPIINIEYAMGEERLLQAYGSHPVLDYETLWYGPSNKKGTSFESSEEYWTGNVRMSDVESEMLSTMEAKEKFVEVQYASVMGERFTMSSTEKRKLDMWIKFNPELFSMMEQSYGITRDVNYAPL
ncbi:hypothetical protein HYV86_01785 [Candidatus Woesearchaeota archaeon]|nr:hypothetical protein [Candidatus Woesearchaeota archaeon]